MRRSRLGQDGENVFQIVRAKRTEAQARGVKLIDDTPRPGAHHSLVAFIHPSSTHGVLVELKQVQPRR